MYFVDREKIEQTLVYYESLIYQFETNDLWDTALSQYALERIVHMATESLLDVGNAMIDGFIMRDPGSYEDIVEILMDEKVITEKEGEGLKQVIQFRKKLLQHYLQIDHLEIKNEFQKQLDSLKNFAPSVRNYLENELGPVSAFRK